MARIAENVAAIRLRMADATIRSGRKASDVTLVGVSKYVNATIARELLENGCGDLGESRPQELWEKAEAIGDTPVRWHLIGHLQRNKVERTLPLVSLIHSGDSMRLLKSINAAAASSGRRVPVLIEVNISNDVSKHGFAATEVEPNLPAMTALNSLEIVGFMAMSGREGDLNQARREFAQLRKLRDQLRQVAPPEINFKELSMGMSGDFEAAIEEGATIVRIGSALYKGIDFEK